MQNPNAECQPRLAGKSQRLNAHDGPLPDYVATGYGGVIR